MKAGPQKKEIVMKLKTLALTALVLLGASLSGPAPAISAPEKLTLRLGGQYCSFYLDDVTKALMGVPGVRHVSYNKTQDQVTVQGNGDKLKESAVIRAINGVKGSSWYCEAHRMN
ncbi:hypothetical protein LptCag_1881 [Leptospirillum ferriphilum]|jgi:copper chaperone CopZ|uniref:HMA domain-containing protein n=3 Tax=Leptospirillum TaxID=179 RepID=A0A094YJ09_9BACT|nr:hypothetical protein ABH19_08690 [Leptospirillum sp. Group II 'CF-1']KGA93186.1 hypothetical protein LptCag_1881 [Leptospirillum ferriphilum]